VEDLYPFLKIMAGPDGEVCLFVEVFFLRLHRPLNLMSCSNMTSCLFQLGDCVNNQDDECQAFPIPDPNSVPLRSVRVWRLDSRASIGSHALLSPLDDELEQAQLRVAVALKDAGCEVQDLVIPEFKYVLGFGF
jgi:hypothetical protein